MPSLFPTQDVLGSAFGTCTPFRQSHSVKPQSTTFSRTDIFQTWSVTDDAKAKAKQLGDVAAKDFEKASAVAQAKAGKIELYSGKYYAACITGGLLACVSSLRMLL